MAVAEAPEYVQKLYTSPANPTQVSAAGYNRPLIFLTDGAASSMAALPGLQRLAANLGSSLSIIHLLGGGGLGLTAAIAALPGDPPNVSAVPEAELDAALDGRTGIVALLSSRRGPLMRLLVGSRCEQLLRHGQLPVLTLPASGQLPRIARVLFPADLSPRSRAAFGEAIALCMALQAELHVLHVYGEDRLLASEQDVARRAAAASPYELLSIDKEQLGILADQASAQGIRTQLRTAEGRAHTQILAYAAANAIDLVVMASHGPRSSEDILLGSTTARAVHSASVAVLAMRA